MKGFISRMILAGFAVLAGGVLCLGQETGPIAIQRLITPPVIDGLVDEEAWQEVVPLNMVTHWPSFGKEIESGTQIRVAYDDEYLYVSGIIYMNPSKISAPTFKRDAIGMHLDHVSIILDTFRDHENALLFVVSPSGSRADLAISNDAQGDAINPSWDSMWEAQARITDFGWSVEMRIPFSSLRFQSTAGVVEMGMIVYNYSAHNVAMDIYPAIPPNWGFWSFVKPSQSQHVSFENIQSTKPVYLTPYVLAGVERAAFQVADASPFNHQMDPSHEAGLDLKTALSNTTTLDLTLNTDFAQVEADDQQVNLTRFSLFFPERRQFFLERASVFDFYFGGLDRLFYSRRIGLSDGLPVRILAGARVISRAGPWDVGVLSMQTEQVLDQPSENNSVIRVRRQVMNPQSYAGGIVTSRIGTHGSYNLAYGLDGIFRLRGDDYLTVNLAQSLDHEINSRAFTTGSLRISTSLQRRTYSGISYLLTYNFSGADYFPAMGFQLRQNYQRLGDQISYGWMPGQQSPLQRIKLSLNSGLFFNNATGSLETSETGPSIEFTWKKGSLVVARGVWISEQLQQGFNLSQGVEVPAGSYRYPQAQIEYHTNRGKPLRAVFTGGAGGFFDGSRFTAGIQPHWTISRRLSLDLFYQNNSIRFNSRQQELIAHIARARMEISFNTRFTFTSFVQYNSAASLGVINARFRYNPRDGNNFYLVFNETLNSHRLRSFPELPLSMNRTLLLKYNYTFGL